MSASRTNRLARLFGAAFALVAAAALAAGPAFAGPADQGRGQAGGNSGVVKIDGVPFDDHPDNQPHVGCTFQVDLTGFPAGHGSVTVTFAAHHPTLADGDDQELQSDEIALTEGAHGLGASRTYTLDLSGITPHDKQGYHVKVTVDTGQGAGKHKVFWVTGCGTSSSTSTTVEHGSTTSGPPETTHGEHGDEDESSTSVTSTTAPEEESSPETTEGPTTTVLVSSSQTPGGGSSLPFTGADSVRLLAVGTLLLLAGTLLLRAGRLRAARARAGDRQPPAPPA